MAQFKLTRDRLVASGVLDSSAEPQLRQAFEDLLAGGAEAVTVDLSGVEMISSVCVGALVVLWLDLRAAGRWGQLLTSPAVKRILDMTGLTTVLTAEAGTAPSDAG